MTIAILVALVSAITMAGVYLTDAVMAGTTYSRPSQPMFLSSLFSFLPAPLLLLWGWQMPSHDAAAMAFIAGVILALTNWLYFMTMYSEAGDCSEIALYECANSLLVTVSAAVLYFLGFAEEGLRPLQWIALILGGVGLFGVQVLGEKISRTVWKYRALLILFSIGSASYKLLLDHAMFLESGTADLSEQTSFLSVTPFFWVGMATGVVVILSPKEWREMRNQIPIIFSQWRKIVLVEVLALLTFVTAVLAMALDHVALMALISGSFPIFVLAGSILLRRVFGIRSERLAAVQRPFLKFTAVMVTITAAYVAVMN